MKFLQLIIVLAFTINGFSQEIKTMDYDTLHISIKYEGKNVFVKNPFTNVDNAGFAVKSVLLNNEVTVGEYNQSAFEIKLSERERRIGEDLNIAIIHLKGMKPEVLNYKNK